MSKEPFDEVMAEIRERESWAADNCPGCGVEGTFFGGCSCRQGELKERHYVCGAETYQWYRNGRPIEKARFKGRRTPMCYEAEIAALRAAQLPEGMVAVPGGLAAYMQTQCRRECIDDMIGGKCELSDACSKLECALAALSGGEEVRE